MHRYYIPLLTTLLIASPARAEEKTEKVKRSNLLGTLDVAGTSPRLFDMPVADVVGAYESSISYDGSLLQNPGLLSSAGIAALGIGDLGQVEYRHTSAVGIRGQSVPLPAVGVQFKLPFGSSARMPALAIAYRFGVENLESKGEVDYTESATDIYGVAHVVLPADIHLHLGVRFTTAKLDWSDRDKDAGEEVVNESFVLPAIGLAKSVGDATAIAEIGRAPLFDISEVDPRVKTGVTGRLGLRWRLHPRVSLDASAGYIAAESGVSPGEILSWDIRLGGEVFIPWGAVACKSISLFCN